jgi:hypothetical protein
VAGVAKKKDQRRWFDTWKSKQSVKEIDFMDGDHLTRMLEALRVLGHVAGCENGACSNGFIANASVYNAAPNSRMLSVAAREHKRLGPKTSLISGPHGV